MKKMSLYHLAWPIFIETALFMFLGFIDVFVLSKYDDLAASAVQIANQSVGVFTLVFTVISGASAVLISQSLGAGDRQKASRIAAISITLNLVIGIIVSLGIFLFSYDILRFIGADDETLEFAHQYLVIVGAFLFAQALLNAVAVIIRNHGKTKTTMYVTVLMNILNTFFDIVFVLGILGFPKLGLQGVAIATSFSRIVGLTVLLIVLFKTVEKPSIFKLLKPFPVKDLISMLKIGVPSALETFNYNLSQLVVSSVVLNHLTSLELITKTYVSNIVMFFYVFTIAIGQASQILVGHRVGAKQFDAAYKQGLRAFQVALLISLVISGLGALFGANLIGIYTQDVQVIMLGASILIVNIFVEMGRTSNIVLISSLRGAGDVLFPTIVAIFSMWLISTLGSYVLSVEVGLGLIGLWIAFAADECFRGVLMFFRWKKGKWKEKRIV